MVERLQRYEQRSATPLVVLAIVFIVVYAPSSWSSVTAFAAAP